VTTAVVGTVMTAGTGIVATGEPTTAVAAGIGAASPGGF
jgi:hypothetical protein